MQLSAGLDDATAHIGPVHRLTSSDLDSIIAIDREITGRSRRGFFEKRLAASDSEPNVFVSLGYRMSNALDGFVLAHVLDGEFGSAFRIGMLDAIGVLTKARGRGIGGALVRDLLAQLRGQGAREVRSQVAWNDHAMLRFLAAADFSLAPRHVLSRSCERRPGEFNGATSDEAGLRTLAHDIVPVRSLTLEDLPSLVYLDRRITNRDHLAYYRRKVKAAIRETGIQVSLVAELDQRPVGFMMARLDYGEFGETEPEAVIDTLGVDPAYRRRQVGAAMLSQLLANLSGLRVERVRTEVEWDNFDLLRFLSRRGFRPSPRLSFARPL